MAQFCLVSDHRQTAAEQTDAVHVAYANGLNNIKESTSNEHDDHAQVASSLNGRLQELVLQVSDKDQVIESIQYHAPTLSAQLRSAVQDS